MVHKNISNSEEKLFRSRYSVWFRALSLVIVTAFLLQDLASAQGGTPLWSEVAQTKSSDIRPGSDPLRQISIPADAGLTRKVVAKSSEDVIINIQDAHAKLGAQESIATILDNLVRNYNLNLIALEGASDVVDTSLVSSFPIREVREKTGKYLLKEGKISAGEFFSMISNDPVKLYGVDDPELYQGNLDAFRSLVENKLKIREQLKALKKVLSELEGRVYSQELIDLSDHRLLGRNGEIKFTEYWEKFSKVAADKGIDYRRYPNLKRLAGTVELEKDIDFKKAQAERDSLIEVLGRKLPKSELEQLVLQSLQFKQNKITPGAFHLYLSRISQGVGLDPLEYKNVILYSQYVVLYEDIDLIAIFDEVEGFENELREKLFTNEDERTLAGLVHCADILSALLDTTLTEKDYTFFVKNSSSCEIAAIRDGLEPLAMKYRVTIGDRVNFQALESYVPDAREFYRLAESRNKALLDNTMKRMKTEGVHLAALITGGFHSEGIASLMDSEKLSYLVVMPKFDDKSPDRPYIAILTKKPKEYEEQFKDSDFYLAAAGLLDFGIHGQGGVPWTDAEREERIPEMKLMVAALLIGAGKHLGTREIPETFLKQFLGRYKEQFVANGEKALVRPEYLEAWLSEEKLVRQLGTDTVTFDGNTYRAIYGPDGSFEDIQVRVENESAVEGVRAELSKEQLAKIHESLALVEQLQTRVDDTQNQNRAVILKRKVLKAAQARKEAIDGEFVSIIARAFDYPLDTELAAKMAADVNRELGLQNATTPATTARLVIEQQAVLGTEGRDGPAEATLAGSRAANPGQAVQTSDTAALLVNPRDLNRDYKRKLKQRDELLILDNEIDQIDAWLRSKDDLPSALVLKKIIANHQRLEQAPGNEGVISAWKDALARQWGISRTRVDYLFYWFKRYIRTADADPELLARTIRLFLDENRKNPNLNSQFLYMEDKALSPDEILERLLTHAEMMQRLFSEDFLAGRTGLKAKIEGTPYFVGFRKGMGQSTLGVEVVIGIDTPDSYNAFAGVILRTGFDTDGSHVLRVVRIGGVRERSLQIDEIEKAFRMQDSLLLLWILSVYAEKNGFQTLLGVDLGQYPGQKNTNRDYMEAYRRFGMKNEHPLGLFDDVSTLVAEWDAKAYKKPRRSALSKQAVLKLLDSMEEVRLSSFTADAVEEETPFTVIEGGQGSRLAEVKTIDPNKVLEGFFEALAGNEKVVIVLDSAEADTESMRALETSSRGKIRVVSADTGFDDDRFKDAKTIILLTNDPASAQKYAALDGMQTVWVADPGTAGVLTSAASVKDTQGPAASSPRAPPAGETGASGAKAEQFAVKRLDRALLFGAVSAVGTTAFYFLNVFFLNSPMVWWLVPVTAALFATAGYFINPKVSPEQDTMSMPELMEAISGFDEETQKKILWDLGAAGAMANQQMELNPPATAGGWKKWVRTGVAVVSAGLMYLVMVPVFHFPVWIGLAAALSFYLMVHEVLWGFADAYRGLRSLKLNPFFAFILAIPLGPVVGILNLFGLAYHLGKIFIFKYFIADFHAYSFRGLGYLFQGKDREKNFERFYAKTGLAWLSRTKVMDIIRLRTEPSTVLTEIKGADWLKKAGDRIEKFKQSNPLLYFIYRASGLGALVDFMKRRGWMYFAALGAGAALIHIGTNPVFYAAFASMVTIIKIWTAFSYQVLKPDSELKRAKGWMKVLIVVRELIVIAALFMIFIYLGNAGALIDPSIGNFNVLAVGHVIQTGQFFMITPTSIPFTVHAFANAMAILAILFVVPMTIQNVRRHYLVSFNQYLAELLPAGRYEEISKELRGENAGTFLVGSFSAESIKELLEVKSLTDEEKLILKAAFYHAIQHGSSGVNLTGLNSIDTKLSLKALGLENEPTAPADFGGFKAKNGPLLLLQGFWETITSYSFWIKVILATPSMWFVMTEIHIIVDVFNWIGVSTVFLMPLAQFVMAIEGNVYKQQEIQIRMMQGEDVPFFDRLWAAGSLGWFQFLFGNLVSGIDQIFNPRPAAAAPPATPPATPPARPGASGDGGQPAPPAPAPAPEERVQVTFGKEGSQTAGDVITLIIRVWRDVSPSTAPTGPLWGADGLIQRYFGALFQNVDVVRGTVVLSEAIPPEVRAELARRYPEIFGTATVTPAMPQAAPPAPAPPAPAGETAASPRTPERGTQPDASPAPPRGETLMEILQRAADATGVDLRLLILIMGQESGSERNPDTAVAEGSSATGRFQITDDTWLRLIYAHGEQYGLGAEKAKIRFRNGHPYVEDPADRARILAMRSDPRIAANMAAELIREITQNLSRRLGRQPTWDEVYAAYVLSEEGFLALNQAPSTPGSPSAADVLPVAANSNPDIFYERNPNGTRGRARTPREVLDRLKLPTRVSTPRDSTRTPDSPAGRVPPEDIGNLEAFMNWLQIDENYRNEVRDLWFDLHDGSPMYVIISNAPGSSRQRVLTFRSAEEFEAFMTRNNVRVRLFLPAAGNTNPDITRISEGRAAGWEELTPADLTEERLRGRNPTVLIEWQEGGERKTGILQSGMRAAEENQRRREARVREAEVLSSARSILAMDSRADQVRLIKEKFGIDVPAAGSPFVAVEFDYNEHGDIIGVKRFITYEQIHRVVGQDQRTGRDVELLVITEPGHNPGEAGPGRVILRYWGWGGADTHRYSDMQRYDPAHPNRGGQYYFGENFDETRVLEVQIGELIVIQERLNAIEYAEYLDGQKWLDLIFGLANLAGINLGIWGAGAQFLYDLIARPNPVGPPTREQLVHFLAVYIAVNRIESTENRQVSLEEFHRMLAGSVSAEDQAAAERLMDSRLTIEERRKLFGYLQKRYDDEQEARGLETAQFLARVLIATGAFEGTLADILGGRWIDVRGNINLPIGGRRITLNANQVVETVNSIGTEARLDSPSGIRVNFLLDLIGIGGFPRAEVQQEIVDAYGRNGPDDPGAAFAFFLTPGPWHDRVQRIETLDDFLRMDRVLVGFADVNGQNGGIPVYVVRVGNRYHIVLLTPKGAHDMVGRVEQDLENTRGWLRAATEGGYALYKSSQYGTFNQRTYTGLFVSHDFEEPGRPPLAYSWDQSMIAELAMLSGDRLTAEEILEFFRQRAMSPTFMGITNAYDANTGSSFEGATIGPTAAIGLAMLRYRQRYNDHRYDEAIERIGKWLRDRQKQNSDGSVANSMSDRNAAAEPNALTQAFFEARARAGEFNVEGDYPDSREYAEAAQHVREWLRTQLWDPQRNLFRGAPGHPERPAPYFVDAQTRPGLAMGPDWFMRPVSEGGLGMTPRQYFEWVRNISQQFGVTVSYNGRDGFKLLDMQDSEGRAGRGVDAGFPEQTAEYILLLRLAAASLAAHEENAMAQELIALADQYQASLDRLRAASPTGSLPQSTVPGIEVAPGLWNAPLGRIAIASDVQERLARAGINIMDIRTADGRTLFQPFQRPTTRLERDPIPTYGVGRPDRQRMIDLRTALVEKAALEEREATLNATERARLAELRAQYPQHLLYVNPDGGEFTYLGEDGLQYHVILIWNEADAREYAAQGRQNLQRSQAYQQALREGGAVLYGSNGVEIRVGRQALREVLEWLQTQPEEVRIRIAQGRFSNFTMTKDGVTYQVSLVFPLDHEFDFTTTDPRTGLETRVIYRDGLAVRIITRYTITNITRTPGLMLEESSETFRNAGTVQNPEQREVISRSRTVQRYLDNIRGSGTAANDPRAPRIVKLVQDLRTGEFRLETYGLYEQPVQVVQFRVDPRTGRMEAHRVTYNYHGLGPAGNITRSESFNLENAQALNNWIQGRGPYVTPRASGSEPVLVMWARQTQAVSFNGSQMQATELYYTDPTTNPGARPVRIEIKGYDAEGRNVEGFIESGRAFIRRPGEVTTLSPAELSLRTIEQNRRFSGYDVYQMDPGGRSITVNDANLVGYGVDQAPSTLFREYPPQLLDAAGQPIVQTASMFFERETNRMTGAHRYLFKAIYLFEADNPSYIASITPDPLYPNAVSQRLDRGGSLPMVIHFNEYANIRDRQIGRVQRSVTYRYAEDRTIGTDILGVSTRRNLRDYVDLDSLSTDTDFTAAERQRLAELEARVQASGESSLSRTERDELRALRAADVRARLSNPDNDFFEVVDYRKHTRWLAMFDREHGERAIARIDGIAFEGPIGNAQLHISYFDETGRVQREHVYLMNGKEIGFMVARAIRNETLDPHLVTLAQRLNAMGFPDLLNSLNNVDMFDIQTLSPDGDIVKVDTVGIFNNYQELVKIDRERGRITLNIFDPETPWIQLAGVDYAFRQADPAAVPQIGESPLGISIVLNPDRAPGDNIRIFTVNAVTGVAIVEERTIYGVVRIIDEGLYDENNRLGTRDYASALDFVRAISNRTDGRSGSQDARSARAILTDGWRMTRRQVFDYQPSDIPAQFTRADGSVIEVDPRFVSGYLETLNVPAKTQMYLVERIDPDGTVHFSSQWASRSFLTVIVVTDPATPGGNNGLYLESFVHDRGIDDATRGGDRFYLQAKNEAGLTLATYQGRVPDNARTPAEEYAGFEWEGTFFLFYSRSSETQQYHEPFGVADKSMRTTNQDGQQIVTGTGNRVRIDENGRVLYAVRDGVGERPLMPVAGTPAERAAGYRQAREKAFEGPIPMRITNSRGEVVSQGLPYSNQAYAETDIDPDGYIRQGAVPTEVTVMKNDPRLSYLGITSAAYTYRVPDGYTEDQAFDIMNFGSLSGGQWTPNSDWSRKTEYNGVREKDGRDIAVYGEQDRRQSRQSIRETERDMSNNMLFSELHEGMTLRDQQTRVYFSRLGLPDYSEVTGPMPWDRTRRIEHVVVFVIGRPGVYFVWDFDSREDALRDFVNGRQIDRAMIRRGYLVLTEEEARQLGDRDGVMYVMGAPDKDIQDRYTTLDLSEPRPGFLNFLRDLWAKQEFNIRNNSTIRNILRGDETLIPSLVVIAVAFVLFTTVIPLILKVVIGLISRVLSVFVQRKEIQKAMEIEVPATPQKPASEIETGAAAETMTVTALSGNKVTLSRGEFVRKNMEDFNFVRNFERFLIEQTAGMSPEQTLEFMHRHMAFWKAVIGYQSGMGSNMAEIRSGKFYPFKKGYIFTAREMDELFAYLNDPTTAPEFAGLGLRALIDGESLNKLRVPYQALNDEQKMLIEMLVDTFGAFLAAKRKEEGIPTVEYPVTKARYHLSMALSRVLSIIKEMFQKPKDDESLREKLASRFWRMNFMFWLLWVVPTSLLVVTYAWGSVPSYLLLGVIPLPFGLIPGVILLIFNARMAYRAITYMMLNGFYRNLSKAMDYHRVNTMGDLRRSLPELLSTPEGREFYKEAVEWLYNGPQGAMISKEKYEELLAILADPSKASSLRTLGDVEAQEYFVQWVNMYFIKSLDIESEDQVKGITVVIRAFTEYVDPRWEDLDKLESRGGAGGANQGAAMVETTFWRTKKQYANQWEYFIDGLLEGRSVSSGDRSRLLNADTTAKDTLDILSGLGVGTEEDIKYRILRWYAHRIETVSKTIETNLFATRKVYEVLGRKFGYEGRALEMWVNKHVQMVIYYGMGVPGNDEFRQDMIRFMKDLKRRNPGLSFAADDEGAAKEMGFAAADPYEPADIVLVSGKFPPLNPTKFNAEAELVRYTRHDFLFEFDAGHRGTIGDFWGLPNELRRFENPKVSWISYDYWTYGDRWGAGTKAAGLSEHSWNNILRPALAFLGTDINVGKGIARKSAIRGDRSQMSEDTAISNEQILSGEELVFTKKILIRQSAEKDLMKASSFIGRFGATVMALFFTPTFQKIMRSKDVHWTKKLVLLWNIDFYPNKQWIIWTNMLMFVSAFFIPWNAYSFLPMAVAFVMTALVFTQAVNTIAIEVQRIRQAQYNTMPQLRGYLDYVRYAWYYFLFYTVMIPLHNKKVNEGLVRQGIFSLTPRSSDAIDYSSRRVYDEFKPAIRLGLGMFVLFLLMPYHPYAIAANMFFFTMAFAWWMGPFLLNYHRSGTTWFFKTLYGVAMSPVWVLQDLALGTLVLFGRNSKSALKSIVSRLAKNEGFLRKFEAIKKETDPHKKTEMAVELANEMWDSLTDNQRNDIIITMSLGNMNLGGFNKILNEMQEKIDNESDPKEKEKLIHASAAVKSRFTRSLYFEVRTKNGVASGFEVTTETGVASGARLAGQISASTLITKRQVEVMVSIGGDLIREFLNEIKDYADDPENSPYKDIAEFRNLWEAARQYKADPGLFTNDYLLNRSRTLLPRIEIRGLDAKTGEAAQVAIIGIPGTYRTSRVDRIRLLSESADLTIHIAGRTTMEVNMKGVDKSIAVDYIERRFGWLLDKIAYKAGPSINARKTRTVVMVDGDGTLYEAPNATGYPLLADSNTKEAVIAYLRAGGLLVVISGGELERTMQRLVENNAIPVELRSNVIVVANGGANMIIWNRSGRMEEVTDYRKNALGKHKPGKVSGLDVIYIGDDESKEGNDYPVGPKVGFNRFVSVSGKPVQEIPEEMRANHVGANQTGTKAVLNALVEFAANHPLETLFKEDSLKTIIDDSRKRLSASATDRTSGARLVGAPIQTNLLVQLEGVNGAEFDLIVNALKARLGNLDMEFAPVEAGSFNPANITRNVVLIPNGELKNDTLEGVIQYLILISQAIQQQQDALTEFIRTKAVDETGRFNRDDVAALRAYMKELIAQLPAVDKVNIYLAGDKLSLASSGRFITAAQAALSERFGSELAQLTDVDNILGEYTMLVSLRALRRNPGQIQKQMTDLQGKVKAHFKVVLAAESDEEEATADEKAGFDDFVLLAEGQKDLALLDKDTYAWMNRPFVVLSEKDGLNAGLTTDVEQGITLQLEEDAVDSVKAAMILRLNPKALLPRVYREGNVFVLMKLQNFIAEFLEQHELTTESAGASA